MLGKAVVQDAAHAAGRKRQNLILQELFEIDGLAAVLIRDDDDVVLADDPFADIRISPQTVSFRLVLESETAEGSEAGNDCVGPEDPFHHLHHAENRNSL